MDNNILINLKNGNFRIDDKILINKELTFDDIKRLAPENEVRDIGNGYKWIYFNREIQNMYYYISVCFNENELYCIIFNVFKYKIIKKNYWNDWSEKEDLKQKKFLDNWMIEFIGATKKQFIWGDIGSYYDKRSLNTGIAINYKKRTHNKA